MISINTHQAKTQLSALLVQVEELGEVVWICRNGKLVAQLFAIAKPARIDRMKPDPSLRPVLHYDPLEPSSEEDWPEEFR